MPRAKGFTSLLAKQRVLRYIEDQQDTAEKAVSFGTRYDLEWEAYQTWCVLNPSARRPKCDPKTQIKVTQWLDQIDLRHVEPLDPDISIGPIVGDKSQEYKQDLMYWFARRKDSIYHPLLRQYPELNAWFHEALGTNYRIESSLVRESTIAKEKKQFNATLSRLTSNTRATATPSQTRFHIQHTRDHLNYLHNARKFIE